MQTSGNEKKKGGEATCRDRDNLLPPTPSTVYSLQGVLFLVSPAAHTRMSTSANPSPALAPAPAPVPADNPAAPPAAAVADGAGAAPPPAPVMGADFRRLAMERRRDILLEHPSRAQG